MQLTRRALAALGFAGLAGFARGSTLSSPKETWQSQIDELIGPLWDEVRSNGFEVGNDSEIPDTQLVEWLRSRGVPLAISPRIHFGNRWYHTPDCKHFEEFSLHLTHTTFTLRWLTNTHVLDPDGPRDHLRRMWVSPERIFQSVHQRNEVC